MDQVEKIGPSYFNKWKVQCAFSFVVVCDLEISAEIRWKKSFHTAKRSWRKSSSKKWMLFDIGQKYNPYKDTFIVISLDFRRRGVGDGITVRYSTFGRLWCWNPFVLPRLVYRSDVLSQASVQRKMIQLSFNRKWTERNEVVNGICILYSHIYCVVHCSSRPYTL